MLLLFQFIFSFKEFKMLSAILVVLAVYLLIGAFFMRVVSVASRSKMTGRERADIIFLWPWHLAKQIK